jgi:flagellar hook-associated protein 2
MSSAGISFGGLASGLDTRAIIAALVAVERRPITQLEAKKTSLTAQKGLFGDLDGLLDKLATASRALKTTSEFLKMKVASDDEEILTATATSAAAAGTHTIEVEQLASAKVHSSTGSASATAGFGAFGTLQLDVGGETRLISVNNPTLDSIAQAINAEGIDVRAEVVDTGNTVNGGANRYQLVIRSTETGADGAFTLSYDDGDVAFQNLIADINANQRAPGQDAMIRVNGSTIGNGTTPGNGILIQRSTNSISGAIAGVTIDLKAVPSPNKRITITVSTDAEETSKKVQEFVDAYNAVVDFVGEQNALDADGKAKNPLFGDVTLRSLRSSLRSVVGGSVSTTGNTAYQMLAQIGITSDRQGKLTFAQSKLEEALTDDDDAVARVFTDGTNGIAGRLDAAIDVYTDSIDGLIKARNEGFDRMVKQTQSRIDSAERRLVKFEEALERKYANLETLLGRLQGQGSAVGNITSFSQTRR